MFDDRSRVALNAREHVLALDKGPLLMGILNVTPDSFYDGGAHMDAGAAVERGHELLEAGADLIDVGGESAVTNAPAVSADEEAERVCPVVESLVREASAVVSVDTYKPAVARAAIDAGASMINDPSGLIHGELAEACAETGAALVVTHTRARPKQKLIAPRYADLIEDVRRFLRARLRLARRAGVPEDRLLICPGPDLGKDPAQTIELLRRLPELHDLGRPLLLAVSRKDFVGALLARSPRDRLAGTLAAVAHGVAAGAKVLRLHDVAEARDFLTVRAALNGHSEMPERLQLEDELRWEPARRRSGEREAA
jgi:dihydropteroate synthase